MTTDADVSSDETLPETPPPLPGTHYYLLVHQERRGPFTLDQLESEPLLAGTLAWHQGLRGWVQAAEIPAIAEILAEFPPPLPGQPPFLSTPSAGHSSVGGSARDTFAAGFPIAQVDATSFKNSAAAQAGARKGTSVRATANGEAASEMHRPHSWIARDY